MSSYSIKIISYLIISIVFISCSNKNIIKKNNKQNDYNERILISVALDYEYNNKFTSSAIVYENLLQKYNRKEYYQKSILSYNLAKKYINVKKLVLKYINKFPNEEESSMHEYIIASIKLKEFDDAIMMSNKLVNKYNNVKNIIILADVYYLSNDYKKAYKYYNISYNLKKDKKILLNIVNIDYTLLHKKKEAISRLESYINNNKCDKALCQLLFKFYQQDNNIDGVIRISKSLFNTFKNTYNKEELSKIKNYIIDLYLKKDLNEAISFLENNNMDDRRLFNIYMENKKYNKALKLVNKIYKNTQDPSLLGQIAILEYETSKDKIKDLPSISSKFEKSINYKSNSNFENYYGYILIEHNIDIVKGLKYITKALKKEPNNYAFKDSLAYGLYKQNKCLEAYNIILEVKNKIGLKNEEINKHWKIIKKCKEK